MSRVLLRVLVALCLIALPCLACTANTADEPCVYGQPVAVWESGMYWTYQTTDASVYVSTAGSLTFILLAPGEGPLSHRWAVGVVTEWYDGSPILHITSTSELPSALCGPGLAWPVIVDHTPPAPTVPLVGDFHSKIKSFWLPWTCEQGPLMLETHSREDAQETVQLQIIGPETVTAPAGVLEETIRSAFSWSLSHQSLEAANIEGTAWWSQDLQWWVRAEGMEIDSGIARSFGTSLADWGVLAPDEMATLLGEVLSSTVRIDDEWAAGMGDYLDRLGVDIIEP